MVARTLFSAEEVSKHNTPGDAWVVIDGGVYDVSKFADEHPGGPEVLLEWAGKDATFPFRDLPHSDNAASILAAFRIGDVCGEEEYEDFQDTLQTRLKAGEGALAQHHREKYDIDLSKAIVPQIPKLGAKYNTWINEAIPGTIILFGPAWMEVFTRTKWWVVPLFWGPVIATLLALRVVWFGLTPGAVSLFALGVFFWMFFEYSLHRFVYHWVPPPNAVCNILHFLLHGAHHLIPMDGDRLVAPPLLAIALIIPLFPSMLLTPWPVFTAFWPGFGCGYMAYDLTHYFIHHTHPTNAWARTVKSNHMKHHYKDHDKYYGVSTPFFDYVFGTI